MKQQQATGEVRVEVNPDGIPEVLKNRRQWVTWIEEERNGELTKVPYTPGPVIAWHPLPI